MSENTAAPQLSNRSVPSVIIAFVILLLLATFAALWRKIDQGAILLHMKTGQVITMTGELPNRDIFSASSSVGIWVYFEWVWGQALHYLNDFGKWKLINAATIVIALITVWLNWMRCRRAGGTRPSSLLVLTFALMTLIPVFQPAPGIAALPVFSLILLLTETRGKRWPLAMYPALVSLWVNISVTAPLALLIPACRAIFPDSPTKDNPEPIRRNFCIFLVAAGLLSLAINPHSFGVYPAWFRNIATCVADMGDRFSSLTTQPWLITEAVFIILLIALSAVRRTLKLWQWAVTVVLILASIILDFSAIHFLLIFLLAPASGALASAMQPVAIAPQIVRTMASVTIILTCLAWAAIIGLTGRLTPDSFGAGVRAGVFPETAAGRLSGIPLRAAILHMPRDAEYLTWRLWPNWRVTIDNRPGFYDRTVRQRYDEIWQGGTGWDKFFKSWNVRAVVGDNSVYQKYPDHNLYQELAASPEWNAVYWDSHSIVYLDSKLELSASNFEKFRQLKPGLPWAKIAENIKTPQQWLDLRADLRRAVQDDPTNLDAVEFLKRAEAATAGQ